ncbi:MAG: sodium-translocating pyrophosphatase [Methylacidiphilales bacterium]|nr:sodium-translocating pyrophosphatase [Candidatus Methylacidiphilales bacterium]
MESLLLNYGIDLSVVCAIGAILVALVLSWEIYRMDRGSQLMQEIAQSIEEGARAYLNRQFKTIAIISACLFVVIVLVRSWAAGVGFLIGAGCSLAAGFIGMRVAVLSNVRTAQGAASGLSRALRVAFSGGAVTGLLVVGLALLAVGVFYKICEENLGKVELITSLIGLALGSSLISVFARLGGGIYTKAADVGADLVGKIEQNLHEDDPRNPATIADNVGDNVGDCAGMAADVFETYVVSLIGAIVIAHLTLSADIPSIVFPFLMCAASVIGALSGILFVRKAKGGVTQVLINSVVISGVVSGLLILPMAVVIFPGKWLGIYGCALIGLVMTAIVVWLTNYYTSTHHRPVRRVAESSETGHATNIIAGLSLGMRATALPVLCVCGAIAATHQLAGLYGIAIAVMSMLSMAGIIISLDAYGPITDNAGGLAVMSGMKAEVRKITDELDAVGNTMKAVTKGYAIASAGLAALVLFGSYVQELIFYLETSRGVIIGQMQFSLMDPKIIIGLFIGGMIPYLFTAMSMEAVGKAAGAIVKEVRRQIADRPGILKAEDRPDYGRCVDIVTRAALWEMVTPALLPVAAVVLVAAVPWLGAQALGAVLVGTIVTGLFLGLSMTSSGGAWDNAKKFIEEGQFGGKGSAAHAAAVTGDTVGDPYKDTAGPAVNPMIKVVNVVAIFIIPIFFK